MSSRCGTVSLLTVPFAMSQHTVKKQTVPRNPMHISDMTPLRQKFGSPL